MPRLVLVTDVPARRLFPVGFSERLHHVVAALTRDWSVTVVAVAGALPHHDPTPEPWLDDDLAAELVVIDAGPNPLLRPGWRGRWRRLAHYLGGRLPSQSHPRRMAPVQAVLGAVEPDLVVVHRSNLAHVALSVPAPIPVVAAVEELWPDETHAQLRRTGLGPARRAVVVRGEPRRRARLYREVGRRATVQLISEEERGRWRALGAGGRVEVVPHGVDPAFFAPDETVERDIDVLAFGRLDHGRNRDALAPILAAARGQRWQWTVLGPGSEPLEAGVGPVVDPRPYLNRAKVVVVPAVDGTGVKTTLLQAWAMGAAVVASPFSARGLPVVAGENALLADGAEATVAAIRGLLADDERRTRIAAQGRNAVVDQRDLRELATRFAALCASVRGS